MGKTNDLVDCVSGTTLIRGRLPGGEEKHTVVNKGTVENLVKAEQGETRHDKELPQPQAFHRDVESHASFL